PYQADYIGAEMGLDGRLYENGGSSIYKVATNTWINGSSSGAGGQAGWGIGPGGRLPSVGGGPRGGPATPRGRRLPPAAPPRPRPTRPRPSRAPRSSRRWQSTPASRRARPAP